MAVIKHPLGEKANAYKAFVLEKYEATSNAVISFETEEKIPVFAMVNGTISKIKEDEELGKTVTLESSEWNYSKKTNTPLYLTYCHLNGIGVKEGDPVVAGAQLAFTGKSGSLAEKSILTLFFAEKEKTEQTKSIDVSGYKQPDGLELKNLMLMKKDGKQDTLKKENLKQYVHKIFAQDAKLTQSASTTDLSNENVSLLVAIVAQERNWGSNDPSLSIIAKSESVCRIIRNRAYKTNSSFVEVALDMIPDEPYNTDPSNFTGSMEQKVTKDYTGVYGTVTAGTTFYDFVSQVISGIDFGLPEACLNSKGISYDAAELYATTGFMVSSRAANYPNSIVVEWDNWACMDWDFYPSNSANTVNSAPPVR